MPKYIDCEPLIDYFSGGECVKSMSESIADARFVEALKKAPAVNIAEVRHGKWIYYRTYYEADECICSSCGQLLTTAKGLRMNYCPNCGAKMDAKGGAE